MEYNKILNNVDCVSIADLPEYIKPCKNTKLRFAYAQDNVLVYHEDWMYKVDGAIVLRRDFLNYIALSKDDYKKLHKYSVDNDIYSVIAANQKKHKTYGDIVVDEDNKTYALFKSTNTNFIYFCNHETYKVNCENCHDCWDTHSSKNCSGCNNCSKCINCKNCKSANQLINCSDCAFTCDCVNCDYCTNTNNCSNCRRAYDECYKCFNCSSIHRLCKYNVNCIMGQDIKNVYNAHNPWHIWNESNKINVLIENFNNEHNIV